VLCFPSLPSIVIRQNPFYGLRFNSLGRHYVYEWTCLIDYFFNWAFEDCGMCKYKVYK